MGNRRWLPYAFIIPSVVTVLMIAIYPIVYAFYLSMTDQMLGRPITNFVGLRNYINNFMDPRFWQFMKTTVVFVVVSVGLQFLIGFGLALLLNMNIRGRFFFRVAMLVPLLIPPITGALMWKIMLDPLTGPVNYLLGLVGLPGRSWLADSVTALSSVIAIDIWIFTPFVALILLAGLQSIPQTMYEAAAVDGARGWKSFRMVTLPMLRPMIYLVLLFRLAGALTAADTIFATTVGGPNIATTTLNFAAFKNLFSYGFMGYAASLGITVFIMIFVITQLLISKTRHLWKGA